VAKQAHDTVLEPGPFVTTAGLLALTLLLPGEAWANQPPRPEVSLGEVAILPLMMLFTMLGGGYAVMRALNQLQGRIKWILAAILAILFSFTQEGLAGLLTWVFVGIAIWRGIRMIVWGVGATKPPEQRAAHLAQAVPWRLIPAGTLICVMAVLIAGLPVAFVGYWPLSNFVEKDLKSLVAYELVKGKELQDAGGNPRYEDPKRNPPGAGYPRLEFQDFFFHPRSFYDVDLKIGADRRSFEIWAWPKRLPFFPYNYLISEPSFYANDSGQVRMIRVRESGVRCPPDAPVYYRVTPVDLSEMKENLRRRQER